MTPPQLLYSIDPKHPTDSSPAFACVEGTVQTDGSVTDLKVLRASDPDMITNSLAAVAEWRYSPATRDGVAVPYPIRIPLFFDVSGE